TFPVRSRTTPANRAATFGGVAQLWRVLKQLRATPFRPRCRNIADSPLPAAICTIPARARQRWADAPWLAWMKKYNASGNVADVFTVYGYSAAQTMVAVLKQCDNNLTRENLMKQAASVHDLKLPMLLPGIVISTSASDFAPIKQM